MRSCTLLCDLNHKTNELDEDGDVKTINLSHWRTRHRSNIEAIYWFCGSAECLTNLNWTPLMSDVRFGKVGRKCFAM